LRFHDVSQKQLACRDNPVMLRKMPGSGPAKYWRQPHPIWRCAPWFERLADREPEPADRLRGIAVVRCVDALSEGPDLPRGPAEQGRGIAATCIIGGNRP
jgi:hypothetical protein